MSKPITLRRAAQADHDRLLTLQSASLRALGSAHYSSAAIEAHIEEASPLLGELISRNRYFVAECGGVPVACGGWSARTSARAFLVSNGRCPPPHATVKAVYVDRAWSQRGFGRRILAEIEADMVAEGHRHADLTATLNSVGFYSRLGYVGSAPSVLRLGRDVDFGCVDMSKALGPSQTSVPKAA